MNKSHKGAAKARGFGLIGAAAAAVVLLSAPSARAADMIHLYDWIADLLQNDNRIKAAQGQVERQSELIDVAGGKWAPNLELTADYGFQDRQNGEGARDVIQQPRGLKLELKQKVIDFRIGAETDQAKAQWMIAQAQEEVERQTVLTEGVQAYLELIRTYKLLRFARASVDNIKRQLELEDARVERGSGLSTDVLQAKSRLAGAEAGRARAEGNLKTATNNFLELFGSLPPDIDMMVEPQPPAEHLPATVEEAVDIAIRANAQVQLAAMQSQLAGAERDLNRATNFFPTVELTTEYESDTDAGNTRGNVSTIGVGVEMKYSWNLAATAIDSLRAAKHHVTSRDSSYARAREQAEANVRRGWDTLASRQENAQFLANQANLSSEFLDLARRERAIGNRDLNDVLTFETQLINATSDAASAELQAIDVVFQLLSAMGMLDLDTIPKPDQTASLGN